LRLAPLGVAGLGVFLANACQPAPTLGPTAPPPTAPAKPAGTGGPPTPAAAAAGAKLPPGYPVTVTAVGARPPDLPSPGGWVDHGYVDYPANPLKFNTEVPGRGGELTYFSRAVYPAPSPLEQNATWQEINKRLNATVRFNYVTGTDYTAKLGTLMAGSDLPDIFCLSQGLGTVSRLSEFLQAQAADLTPFLAGDGIRNYPNLAFIPTHSWKNAGAVVNGKVYLLPIQQYRVGSIMFHNAELWSKEAGEGYTPKDAEDFKRILQALTRPQDNRWGIGGFQGGTNSGFALPILAPLFGAPHGWRLGADGRLLKDRETEEFKAAVGFARDLYVAGVYHPDQITFNTTTARNAYLAGRVAVVQESFGGGWTDLWLRGARQNPPVSFNYMVPFAAQAGVKPVHFMTSGVLLANGLRKASPERVQEILRVMNWLAAPFGSQEDLLLQYGLKDLDYTLDDSGNPVPTPNGPQNSIYVGWQFIARHPWTLYYPGLTDFAKVTQDAQKALLAMGIEDPTWGTFAPTFLSKGASLETTFADGVNDLISGRRPFSDYDVLVKEWRDNGGEQMRKEYSELIAAQA
jgi:putative aldouronate transport system substrate-binding protein